MTTDPATTADRDAAVVRTFFAAVAGKDMPALGRVLAPDATWNHRNDDRLGGTHHGRDAILAYIGQSVQLTNGTLHAVPQSLLTDGAGRVAVLVQLSASRPDGRSMDGLQAVVFGIEGDQVHSVDQFVGDPPAVAAFWA